MSSPPGSFKLNRRQVLQGRVDGEKIASTIKQEDDWEIFVQDVQCSEGGGNPENDANNG